MGVSVGVAVGVGEDVGVAVDVGVGSNPGIPSEHPAKRISKTDSSVKQVNLVYRNKIILRKKVEYQQFLIYPGTTHFGSKFHISYKEL